MQEQKLFKEGDIAITTHRIVWGDRVISMEDIKAHRLKTDDRGTPAVICAVIAVVLFLIGAQWSMIAGLVFVGLAVLCWFTRTDECTFTLYNGEDVKFRLFNKRPLFRKVEAAIKKQQDIVRRENKEGSAFKVSANLSEIDKLPDVSS